MAGTGLAAPGRSPSSWSGPGSSRRSSSTRSRPTIEGKVVIGDWWFGLATRPGVSGRPKLAESLGQPIRRTGFRPTGSRPTSRSPGCSAGGLDGRPGSRSTGPQIAFRLDAKGQPITKIPVPPPTRPVVSSQGGRLRLPEIVTKNGEITLDQEGSQADDDQGGRRPALARRLMAASSTSRPTTRTGARSRSPAISTRRSSTAISRSSPARLRRRPGEAGEHPVHPHRGLGQHRAPRAGRRQGQDHPGRRFDPKPVTVHTDTHPQGDGRQAQNAPGRCRHGTTGRMSSIDDALVKPRGVWRGGRSTGRSRPTGRSTSKPEGPPKFDLDLSGSKGIDVTKTPHRPGSSARSGATGKLSGNARPQGRARPLRPRPRAARSGRAVIEGGSFQGIPVKSLGLGLKADGERHPV